MLKDLHIKNLVLMDSCKMEFDPRLTILTGETGSGKTAILQGLKLLLGQKLDVSSIRKGEKKGSIQGGFDIHSPRVEELLTSVGIDLEDSRLILYREVSVEGKSKNFINERSVSLSFMNKVGSLLVGIVDQGSHEELRSEPKQRRVLDLFGSLEKEVDAFGELLEKSKELALEQDKLLETERQKERELDFCKDRLAELSAAEFKEGEEELLFREYSLFSDSKLILEKVQQLLSFLTEDNRSILSTTGKAKSLCKSLSSYHTLFKEGTDLLEQAFISTEEASRLLTQSLTVFECDPRKLELLEQKVHKIHLMKKKYGSSAEDWKRHKMELEQKIALFESIEERRAELQAETAKTEEKLSFLAKDLSEKRTCVAKDLSTRLETELRSLNMPSAEILISVERESRSPSGEDAVSFKLRANPGEALTGVKEHSSGGELSRLLLALKLSLAKKNGTPTLIFDEIDANVGGETAKMVGKKLRLLSDHVQVVCITHFPQVASFASSHLLVRKKEETGRTFSVVESLDEKGKAKELLRMLGGKALDGKLK